MPRYRKRSLRNDRYDDSHYRYDDYDSRSYRPRRRRGGCLAPIQRFFRNLLIVLLVAVGAIVFFCLVLLIAFNFKIFVEILYYGLFVAAGLALLGILYLVVRMIAAISGWLSVASEKRAKAKVAHRRADIERERVNEARLQVEAHEAKLARDAYQFYDQQQEQYYQSPRRTRVIRQEEGYYEEERPLHQGRPTRNFREQEQPIVLAAVGEPEPAKSDLELLGMPAKGQVFYYRDYRHLLKPGKLIVGIRSDGTARIADWQDFKVMLILGSSSSGKSSTTLEKCLCVVNGGGQLCICDPGGFKPDSLTQRLGSLQTALMPGSVVALEHEDIMKNMELFRDELERRRRGAPIQIPVLLVVDELNGILMDRSIKKELTELLEKFGQQARGYNMYLILCAQRSSGLSAIRNSVISFVVHKSPTMESSKLIDMAYAKHTPRLGIGQTFVTDANGEVEALQQVLVLEEDINGDLRTTITTYNNRQTEPVIPPRQYGAISKQQKLLLRRTNLINPDATTEVMQPQQTTAPIPREPTATKIPRRQTASRPPTRSTGASSIWGDTTQPVLPLPVTDELAPRLQQNPQAALDNLAALRDKQRQKK